MRRIVLYAWVAAFILARLSAVDSQNTCDGELTSIESCDCTFCTTHNSTWLRDFCCRFKGIPATLLAFEPASAWAPRLSEFNKCTGARVTLTYNGQDGQGNEDTMEEDLRDDVGVKYIIGNDAEFQQAGAGIV
jgi:hypothetical protein